jgi:probable addiction module antidote protein
MERRSLFFSAVETKETNPGTSKGHAFIGRIIGDDMKNSRPLHSDLMVLLKDPEAAVAYLNAALEEGDRRIFLMALREVAEARGGLSKLSQRSKLHRVNLYRILSKQGNPEIQSLETILKILGFRLAVVQDKHPRIRKAA